VYKAAPLRPHVAPSEEISLHSPAQGYYQGPQAWINSSGRMLCWFCFWAPNWKARY